MSKKKRHHNNGRQKRAERKKVSLFRCLVIVACCCGVMLCMISIVFLLRANQMLTVATVAEHAVGQAELQYYYVEEIEAYQDQVGRYGGEYTQEVDFTRPLSQQNCPLTSGITWHTYFMENALEQIQWEVTVQNQAREAGFSLSETEQNAVSLRLSNMEAIAEEAGISIEDYLSMRYGKNVTTDLVVELENRRMTCICYMTLMMEQYTPSEKEIEAYFQSNRRWNMLADYWAVPLDSTVEDQERILADLEASRDEEDFLSQCAVYVEGSVNDRVAKHVDAVASDMEDYTVAEWTLSEERQPGDITVVESYDETADQRNLIALYFLKARRNDKPTYAFQEILLMPHAIRLKDTEKYWGNKQSEDLLQFWENEETFGVLAATFSSLSSGEQMGYRVAGADALSGQPYAAWLMDEERGEGDVEVFETEYGVYLIRYVGEGDADWENNAREALQTRWWREQRESVLQTAPIRTNLIYPHIK